MSTAMSGAPAPASVWEREARQHKTTRLVMAIDAALHGWGKDAFSWDAVAVVESMGDSAWACAASCAGVPMPSETTRAAVVDVYRVRALRTCGAARAA